MLLNFLEKREETEKLTEEEKIFLKIFGVDSDQPMTAMKEVTYFTCGFPKIHSCHIWIGSKAQKLIQRLFPSSSLSLFRFLYQI